MALFTYLAAIACYALYAFVPDFEGDMRILGAALGSTAVTGQFTADVIDVSARHCALQLTSSTSRRVTVLHS